MFGTLVSLCVAACAHSISVQCSHFVGASLFHGTSNESRVRVFLKFFSALDTWMTGEDTQSIAQTWDDVLAPARCVTVDYPESSSPVFVLSSRQSWVQISEHTKEFVRSRCFVFNDGGSQSSSTELPALLELWGLYIDTMTLIRGLFGDSRHSTPGDQYEILAVDDFASLAERVCRATQLPARVDIDPLLALENSFIEFEVLAKQGDIAITHPLKLLQSSLSNHSLDDLAMSDGVGDETKEMAVDDDYAECVQRLTRYRLNTSRHPLVEFVMSDVGSDTLRQQRHSDQTLFALAAGGILFDNISCAVPLLDGHTPLDASFVTTSVSTDDNLRPCKRHCPVPLPPSPASRKPPCAVAQGRVELIRRSAVDGAFMHDWRAYVSHAWGEDVLQPLSRTGAADICKLAMSLVDALDTLLVLGHIDEFAAARDWVAANLTIGTSAQANINVFETVIRVIGGLVSAYHLAGGGAANAVLVNKADELMTAIIAAGAFQTLTGIPYGTVTLPHRHAGGPPATLPSQFGVTGPNGSYSYNPEWTGGASSLSEAGTLSLELLSLAAVTGKRHYAELAHRITRQLVRSSPGDGLMPIYVDPASGSFRDVKVGIGGHGDSAYEYFLKGWLLLGGWSHQKELAASIADIAVSIVRQSILHPFAGTQNGSSAFTGTSDEHTPAYHGARALVKARIPLVAGDMVSQATGYRSGPDSDDLPRVPQMEPSATDAPKPSIAASLLPLPSETASATEPSHAASVAAERVVPETQGVVADEANAFAQVDVLTAASPPALRSLSTKQTPSAAPNHNASLPELSPASLASLAAASVSASFPFRLHPTLLIPGSIDDGSYMRWAFSRSMCGVMDEMVIPPHSVPHDTLTRGYWAVAELPHSRYAPGSTSHGDAISLTSPDQYGRPANYTGPPFSTKRSTVPGREPVLQMDHLACYLPGAISLALMHDTGHPAIDAATESELVVSAARKASRNFAADVASACSSHVDLTVNNRCLFADNLTSEALEDATVHVSLALHELLPDLAHRAHSTQVRYVAEMHQQRVSTAWDALVAGFIRDGVPNRIHPPLATARGKPQKPSSFPVPGDSAIPERAFIADLNSRGHVSSLLGVLEEKWDADIDSWIDSGVAAAADFFDGNSEDVCNDSDEAQTAPVQGGFCSIGVSAAAAREGLLLAARELSRTCVAMYTTTASGLAPEIVSAANGTGSFSTFAPNIDAVHSLLRPEAVESLFLMHALTGEQSFRDQGWEIFAAMESHSRVQGGGHASVNNVTLETCDSGCPSDTVAPSGACRRDNQRDKTESFVFAETWKYLFLLFSGGDAGETDLSVRNLREWVFSTEAHPLPVLPVSLSQAIHSAQLRRR